MRCGNKISAEKTFYFVAVISEETKWIWPLRVMMKEPIVINPETSAKTEDGQTHNNIVVVLVNPQISTSTSGRKCWSKNALQGAFLSQFYAMWQS